MGSSNCSSCCSIVAKDQLEKNSATSGGKVVSFRFSHELALDNKGKIDDIYDVSKTRLGEGSGGIVYTAVHKGSLIDRAVKSIPTKVPGEAPTEVLILRSMDHPNIVKLYETFQDLKRTYLVMEVCSGGELLNRILQSSERGQFTENQAATYVEQILSSIIYLHSNEIAHRDIRSENFLLQDSSDRSEVKLIDFALAKQCEGENSLTTRCGSAHYMAPEIPMGAYSKKCDIWSCGVFLYVMLFGCPPFEGDDDAQVLLSIQRDKLVFQDRDMPISQTAHEFLGLLLEKDPQARSSAEPLVKHKFIRCGNVSGAQPLPSMVKKLQKFNSARQLKKVCLTLIAKQLPKKDVEDLRLYFKTLDKNSDGTISKQELIAGLENVAKAVPGMDPKDIGCLMDNIDSDGSGSIDYTEFLAAALDRKIYAKQDVVWSAFRTFDVDGSGKIDKSELKQLLESTGESNVTDQKIQAMMREADKNNDGHLDFEEFMSFLLEE